MSVHLHYLLYLNLSQTAWMNWGIQEMSRHFHSRQAPCFLRRQPNHRYIVALKLHEKKIEGLSECQ